jgi:DNA-binding NarL/FixJ family response regulator
VREVRPSPSHRILVVDDSPYARRAVREVLASAPEFTVVGEAADAREALDMALRLQPDLILMDVRLPGVGGIAATARIKARLPACRIVMLSVSDDVRDLFAAIRSGAQGYLLKHLDPADWTAYLRQVLSGEAPISREIATRILQEFAGANPLPAVPLEALTPREEEVLRFVAAGHSNREVAARLDIAEGTVKNHLRNILGKLHLKNRTELASYAFQEGIVRTGRGSDRGGPGPAGPAPPPVP